MDCAKCSKDLDVGSYKFCPFCGATVELGDDTIVTPMLSEEDFTTTLIETPALTDDDLQGDDTELNDPADALDSTPDSKPSGDSPPPDRFSETAWFMAAVSPEQLAESEGEPQDFNEQERMTEAYETDEPLPDGVRKEYSLTMGRTKVVQPEDLEKDKPKK